MSQHRLLCLFTAGFSAATMLSAQPAQVGRPTFEVASVRVAAPISRADPGGKIQGGPGTSDPGLIRLRGYNLRGLILKAYHAPSYRLTIPDSFAESYFDIVANLPAGTNQEQLELMLQNLLADRFELRLHLQPTSFDTYKIVVAKGGPKLTPTTFTDVDVENHTMRVDPDGGFLAPGHGSGSPHNGVTTFAIGKAGMPDLARFLETYLFRPVKDGTDLPGEYDIKFTAAETGLRGFSTRSSPSPASEVIDPAPDLFQALEQQLGLKLEKSKALLDVIVVDSALAVPTEN